MQPDQTCALHARIPKGTPTGRTLAGFVKFRCPSCGNVVVHRLSFGYRILYWLIIIGFIALLVTSYESFESGSGMGVGPGGLAFLLLGLAAYGLIRDQFICQRLNL